MTKSTLTIMQCVRSIGALARAEKQYAEQGYDPVEAAHLIYDRALSFYDSVFPTDEPDFRRMLMNRRERVLKRAYRQRANETRERY